MKLEHIRTKKMSEGYLQQQDKYPYEIIILIDGRACGMKELKKYRIQELSHDEREMLEKLFNSRLLMWRVICGKMQREVSLKTKIPPPQLSRYERGTKPSVRNMRRIAKALNLPSFLLLNQNHLNYLHDLLRYGATNLVEDILSLEKKEGEAVTDADAMKIINEFSKFGVGQFEKDLLMLGFRHRKEIRTESYLAGYDEWMMADEMFDAVHNFKK